MRSRVRGRRDANAEEVITKGWMLVGRPSGMRRTRSASAGGMLSGVGSKTALCESAGDMSEKEREHGCGDARKAMMRWARATLYYPTMSGVPRIVAIGHARLLLQFTASGPRRQSHSHIFRRQPA